MNGVKTIINLVLKTMAIVFGVIVLALVIYLITTTTTTHVNKERYLALPETSIDELFEISDANSMMFDEDTYEKFESLCLGNKNSNLLSYGKYYDNGNIKCEIKDGKTVLTRDSLQTVIRENSVSYINVVNGNLYYRDDLTRNIYKYQIDTAKTDLIVKSQCGQVIVSKKGVSYIDFSDNILKYISFENDKTEKICEKTVKSFAIIGDKYLCLTCDGDFGILKPKGRFNLLTSNVDRFFCDGNVMVQKNDSIYLLSHKNNIFSKRIEQLDDEFKGVLVGCFDNKIFSAYAGTLYSYDSLNTDKKKRIFSASGNTVIQGVYKANESYVAGVLTYTEEKKNFYYEMISNDL